MGREAGVGLVGTIAGVTAFLVLLFFAVHVLLGLYVRSAVTAAAFDAARIAAADGPPVQAEQHVGALVGGVARDLEVTVAPGHDFVEVHVVARSPRLLWPRLMQAVGVETTARTIRIRREELVP